MSDNEKPVISITDALIGKAEEDAMDPLVWEPSQHVDMPHLVITDGTKQKQELGFNNQPYTSIVLPTIIIFHVHSKIIFRYDNVVVKKTTLRKALSTTTKKALYGRLRFDELTSPDYPFFHMEDIPEDSADYKNIKLFIEQHFKLENDVLTCTYKGANSLPSMDDGDSPKGFAQTT